MNIIEKDINWFKPLEKNVRKHNDTQITALAKSIKTYGVTRPMVCDEEGTVLVGNGLLAALKQMGVATASCIIVPNLSDAQKKKLIITDNHIYDLGYTDADVQTQFIRDIIADGDMDIPGFDDDILNALKSEMAEGDNKLVEKMDDGFFAMSEENASRIKKEAQEFVVPAKTISPSPSYVPSSGNALYGASEGNPVPSSTPEHDDGEYIEAVCPHCGATIRIKVR